MDNTSPARDVVEQAIAPHGPIDVLPSHTIAAEIEQGFSGTITPVRASLKYRLMQAIVAVAMVLLPAAYVALIGGISCLCVLYAVYGYPIATRPEGKPSLFGLFIYTGPLAAGAILVFFMFKPLFARPLDTNDLRRITPEDEPHVFALAKRIAATAGAPIPKRIEVVCEVDAAASFPRGFRSFVSPNDFSLVIGMPLVSGLTLQQFAGVIAHELGHFSQGGGMRLSYVVRRINGWFARVVYERDSWDLWLEEAIQSLDFRLAWIFSLARLAVVYARGILWCLMKLGFAISGAMMRQMELNADLVETRVVGTDTFATTSLRMLELAVGWQATRHDTTELLNRGQLPDNLAKLLLFNVDSILPDVRKKMREVFETEQTGMFDSHPVSRDRIAASARENAPGVFRSDRPASDLFVYYESLCKNVTWDYYRAILGPGVKPNSLTSTDELLRYVQLPTSAGPPTSPSARPQPEDPDAPIPLAD